MFFMAISLLGMQRWPLGDNSASVLPSRKLVSRPMPFIRNQEIAITACGQPQSQDWEGAGGRQGLSQHQGWALWVVLP